MYPILARSRASVLLLVVLLLVVLAQAGDIVPHDGWPHRAAVTQEV